MSLLFDRALRELPRWRDGFSSIWAEMYASTFAREARRDGFSSIWDEVYAGKAIAFFKPRPMRG